MKHVYTLLFIFYTLLGFADGMHIKGVIKDMDSNHPVKDAAITVTFYSGLDAFGSTDSLGRYEITSKEEVPEGDYSIQIQAKNYYSVYGFIHVKKESFIEQRLKRKSTAPPELTAINTAPVKPVLEGYATNNLVFLIDISSSMNTAQKFPLLKESLKYLVNELRPTDRIAILTFSSNVKEVLPSTPVTQKELILKTIDGLSFGSTTQGGAALDIAYKTALRDFVTKGNNRIVLASDGLFTAGEKDYKKMEQVIQDGSEKNIALSVFCFGKNTEYVNGRLKKLTSTGHGNFATINNIDEAKLYMLEEAKAVKD
ncbi:MAG: uncharacterized protein JWN78_1873 [Bacteroidota bacterium]|nr:uncharacterized protein [Bacteroidota bacterium]